VTVVHWKHIGAWKFLSGIFEQLLVCSLEQ